MKQAPLGLKRRKAFRENYLAVIIAVAALFLNIHIYGQTLPTKPQLQAINATGYEWQTGSFKRGLYLPDTLSGADSGAIAKKNGIVYFKNGLYWKSWGFPVQVNDSTFTCSGITITIHGTAGETNTASNQGSGVGLFKTKSGVDLQFKSLTRDTTVTITSNINDVQFGINSNIVSYTNYLNRGVPFTNYSIFLGNSITYGYNSGGGTLKSYPSYLKDHLNLDTVLNLAVSGIGARRAYRILAENITIDYNKATSAMAGFNNVRGTTDTAHVFELVRASHRAMAALQFIKRDEIQFYTMGTSGSVNPNVSTSIACGSCSATSEDSLQEYGSRTYWHRHNDAANTSSNWWKKPSITANETVTISNVGGGAIAIGTWAATSVWSRIEVRVDGTLKTTYDPNGRIGTYWADGFINNGVTNDAIIITGLRDTLHTVQLKFLDAGAMGGWDYVAPLRDPEACLASPLYVWDLPHMNSTGYSYVGGVVTEAQLDSCTSSRWRDLQYYFPGYPIFKVATNAYYDPLDNTQIQSDGIHPTSYGEWKIAKAAIDAMGPKWLQSATGGGSTLDAILTNGNTSSQRLLLTGSNGSNSNMEVGSDIALQVAAPSVSWIGSNMKYNGSNNVYLHNGYATQWYLNNGGYMQWLNGTSGSTGGTATMNTRFSIRPNGNIDIGGLITNSTNGAGSARQIDASTLNVTLPSVAAIGPTGYSISSPLRLYAISGQPGIALYNSTGSTNQKIWDITAGASTFNMRMGNDAYSAATDWLIATRSGYTSANVSFPAGNVSVTGSVTVNDDAYDATGWDGNNTVPTKNAVRDKFESLPIIYKGSTTWQPGVVAAGSSTTTTITVTGASLGDPVTVSKASGAYSNGEIYDAFVSATNTVTVRVHNVSTGSANYNTTETYKVVVLKY